MVASKLSEQTKKKSIFYRIVLGKYASLQELKECWTLEEVLDITEILDAQETVTRLHQEAQKKK